MHDRNAARGELFFFSTAPANLWLVWAGSVLTLKICTQVLRTEDICSVGKEMGRLEALIMGTSDLTKELRAVHTPCRFPTVTLALIP